MAPTLKELRGLTHDELVERHDRIAPQIGQSVTYYLNEVERRDRALHDERMLQVSNTMKRLTWVITGLTALNVLVAALGVSDWELTFLAL